MMDSGYPGYIFDDIKPDGSATTAIKIVNI